MPPVRLYVATPAYGCYVTKEWLSSMILLRAACARKGHGTSVKLVGNESLITRGRNLIVADFLKTEATHLMFIDADIKFEAEDVISMLEQHDMDVLCGVYAKKSFNWKRRRAQPMEPVQQVPLEFNLNLKQVRNTPVMNDQYVEVLDAATGFMLIQRHVIERVCEAFRKDLECVNDVNGDRSTYVAIFDCMIDPDTRRYLSEDYAFCRRWQQIGGKVHVDLACRLAHVGAYGFDPTNPALVQPYGN